MSHLKRICKLVSDSYEVEATAGWRMQCTIAIAGECHRLDDIAGSGKCNALQLLQLHQNVTDLMTTIFENAPHSNYYN